MLNLLCPSGYFVKRGINAAQAENELATVFDAIENAPNSLIGAQINVNGLVLAQVMPVNEWLTWLQSAEYASIADIGRALTLCEASKVMARAFKRKYLAPCPMRPIGVCYVVPWQQGKQAALQQLFNSQGQAIA